ncbi:MAG: glycosyltransferase family 9 protein [Verrucomicrobiota bacterium]
MKVLIHKADHLGDFVLALPALWELRQSLSHTSDIHQLVRKPNLEWQQILPWLGTLHPLNHPRYERYTHVPKLKLSFLALWQAIALRDNRYDWGIDLVSTCNDLLGKWLLIAAGCHKTSGPDGAHSWMLSRAYPQAEVHQTKLLADRFPKEWNIQGKARPEDFMPDELRWNSNDSEVILLAPFVGDPIKAWPYENWIKLFAELSRNNIVKMMVPELDREKENEFLSHFPHESLVLVSSILETLNLLKSVRCAIVLDTAAAHYAWLTGTPFIQLFSGTALAERWAPISGGIIMKCMPIESLIKPKMNLDEYYPSLNDISVDDVLEELGRFMKPIQS